MLKKMLIKLTTTNPRYLSHQVHAIYNLSVELKHHVKPTPFSLNIKICNSQCTLAKINSGMTS